jgi:DNA-binding PadR family transcriptional regulator
MSSHGEGRGTQQYQGVPNPQVISHHIHDWQPVLKFPAELPDDREDFTLGDVAERLPSAEIDLAAGSGRHLLQQMELHGLLKITERGTGDDPARYRWRAAGREAVRDYLDGIETLPCSCRQHIPDTRDDAPGVVSCKYCGHQYDREQFREMIDGL